MKTQFWVANIGSVAVWKSVGSQFCLAIILVENNHIKSCFGRRVLDFYRVKINVVKKAIYGGGGLVTKIVNSLHARAALFKLCIV